MTKEKTTLKKIRFDVQIPNFEGDGIAYSVPLEVQACTDPETGEDVLTPESIQLIEKTQARYMGLMDAADIKALRQRLDISQQEMSDLLQIGAKTYTRWESGRDIPSRSMNVLLCALRDGQLSLNYLRALRHPAGGAVWNARTELPTMLISWVETTPTPAPIPSARQQRETFMDQHISDQEYDELLFG